MELHCMMQLGCCHGITLYDATRLLQWNYVVWWNCHVAMELFCMVKLGCCHGITLYGETAVLPWNYIVWWKWSSAVAMELCCMVQLSCHHENCVAWWNRAVAMEIMLYGESLGFWVNALLCQGASCIKCLLVRCSHNTCCGQLDIEVHKSLCMHLEYF